MPEHTPSYSKRLPLLVVLLCYLSLAAIVTASYVNLKSADRGRGVRIQSKGLSFDLPRNQFMTASLAGAGALASKTIQSINMPGMFGEVVASFVMRTWPDSWRPALFGAEPPGLFVWRGWILPLYCVPFWWFAGLGIDQLRGHRPLRWPVNLFGTLLAAFLAFITVVLAITAGTREYQDMAFVFFGLAPWTLLMMLFPIAWARNFRSRRNLSP